MKITKRLVSVLLVFSMIASMFLTVTAVENTAPAAERTGITVEREQSADVFGEAVTHTKGYYISDKKLEALPVTYEAWVYIPSEVYDTASGVILGTQWDAWDDTWNGAGSGDVHFSFGIKPGGHPTLVYGVKGNKQVWEATKGGVIPADKWTHVVMAHDTRTSNRHVWCFIDAGGEGGWQTFEKVGQGAGLLELDASALDNPVFLAGDSFRGNSHALSSGIILGDVAVYSDLRAASAGEVKYDYENGADLSDPNLLLYYQISSANQNKDIKDASGHGYDMNFYRTFLTEAEMNEIRAEDEYEYAYSIAFLPDLQYMTNRFPTKLGTIFDYIIDNKEEKNIQYVVGLGDITDNDKDWEWNVVKAQYDLLDAAGIPYTLVRGNHDIYTTDKVMFDQTFGKDSDYYKHVAANGGFYDANSATNAYVRFEVGNVKYLILCLDWGIKDTKVLDWADQVIADHPDRNVIVTMHAWMNSDATIFEDGDWGLPSSYAAGNINPLQMWNNYFAKHTNIDMVVCGHMHSDNIFAVPVQGTNGNTVYQILIDSQASDLSVANGGYNGLGLVALMHFTEDGNHAKIEYYSTTYNKYYYEKNTEISLDFGTSDNFKEDDTPVIPETPETPVYDNCTDAAGNVLNPYFVNGVIWDNEDGNLFLPEKVGKGFLLFDNELENNRIEATIVVKDNMGSATGYDGNKRAGIVFALTDYDGDRIFNSAEADVSYYWAFINNWGHVELRKMGRYQCWTGLGTSATPIDNVTEGVKLAAEWDDQGHIVIYANGEIVINITDTTDPLSGDLYGLLAVKHYNYASNPALVNSYYTSFVADGASETPVKNVSVTVDPAGAGTVTGAGDYYLGQNATLTATPSEGYYFVGWYVGDTLVLSDMTVTFPVTEDLDVTAKFTTVAHNVTVTAGANGTVAGSGTYGEGANVTVVATPDTGYKFVGWYKGETKVSTSAAYTFTLTENVELVAKFDTLTYSVAVDAQGNELNPYFVSGNVWTEANGTLKPAVGPMENFLLFDTPLNANRVEATFDLTLNNDGNTRNGIAFALTDIDGDRTFGMGTDDVSYWFACISGYGEIQLIKMGAGKSWTVYITGGVVDVTGGITLAVEWDAQGNVKVFANGKLCIEKNLGEALTGNLYGVLMRSWANTADGGHSLAYRVTSVVAGGASTAENVNIGVTVDPTDAGTVTGAGEYYVGQSVTVTATPNAGYNFVGWFNGETQVSADATYTFKAEADCTLTAKFTSITYTVTVIPGENGTVTGAGSYGEGANATLTAIPDAGCKLVGWFIGETKVSTDVNYTFTVTKDVELTAKFEKITSYSVAVDACGDLLNPYFVNGNIWTEADGAIKPAPGTMENFLLFDNELNANRIEATFRNLPLNKDNNTRHGIVFAVTDNNGDHLTGINDGGANYWFVCVSGYGEIQLIGFPGWKGYTTGGIVDVSKDVTLAVEWDAEGNVKVFANGNLVIDQNVGEPLTGNLYGILMRSYANTADAGFVHKVLATSFVAGIYPAGGGNEDEETVTVNTATTEGGTVAGAGEYELGTSVTLTATANAGYKFIGWFVGDELVSEDAEFTFTAEESCEFTAKFELDVIEPVCGDANGDGTLNEDDVALIREYIARFNYDANTSSVNVEAGADFNGDGQINMKDIILLRQYIANNG